MKVNEIALMLNKEEKSGDENGILTLLTLEKYHQEDFLLIGLGQEIKVRYNSAKDYTISEILEILKKIGSFKDNRTGTLISTPLSNLSDGGEEYKEIAVKVALQESKARMAK